MQTSDFNSWLSELELNTENMTSSQLASLHANYQGRTDANDADIAAVGGMIFASSDPVAVEDKRIRQIEAACRGDWDDRAERVQELKASAVGGELDVDGLVIELRNLRKERIMADFGNLPPAARNNRDMHPQIAEAAICLAGCISNPEQHYSEQVLDAADTMRGSVSLQQLIMGAATQNGYRAQPAETITQSNLRPVLQAAFGAIRATGFSTLSLPGILSNTASKFLLDGWQEVSGDEWRKISETKPVKDFKTATFYRLLESAEYEEVPPQGELKHGQLGEQSMSVKADTYGRMYAIDRQTIINDDLGSLTDIPRRLGRAAGMKFRRIFWKAFLAPDGFWDASNGNVLTGSGTALTVAGTALDTALAAFRAMRTSEADGRKLIGGKPAVLMVPPALEIVARRLLTSTGIVAGGDTGVGVMPSGNPYSALAELVVSDSLQDSDFTGWSAAKWYLLRSPNIAPSMLVAFLNGQQAPTVETADADFNVLGIQMRGFHDFGVGRGEPLAGLQVAGTA